MWTETLAFFHAAAERPQGIVDGSCKLQLSGCRAAKVTERSKRAELDMIRIRGKANGNELVKQMLTAAFHEDAGSFALVYPGERHEALALGVGARRRGAVDELEGPVLLVGSRRCWPFGRQGKRFSSNVASLVLTSSTSLIGKTYKLSGHKTINRN